MTKAVIVNEISNTISQGKTLIACAVLLMVTATGCSGSKEAKADKVVDGAQTEIANADIRGQRYIENIVFSDSDYVRPNETSSSMEQYIVFEDSTYFIMTNCNSFSTNCFSMVDAKNRKLCRTLILTPTFQEVKMSPIFHGLSELCLWNYLAMWILDCF